MCGWDLAEWMDEIWPSLWMRSSQVVKASYRRVLTVPVQSQHPPTQWNLRAADEEVLNKVLKKISPFAIQKYMLVKISIIKIVWQARMRV